MASTEETDTGARALAASRFARVIPPLTAAVVVGVLVVAIEVSFASLIFSGPLAEHRGLGIGVMLAGATVMILVVGLLAPTRGMVAIPQDTVVAIMAVTAGAIAAQIPGGGPTVLLTVLATLVVAAVVLAIAFGMVGALGLGNLLRYVPYPVIGGFLAGTGWLLLDGAVGVMADVSLLASGAFAGAALARWLPGLALAVLVLALLRRIPNLAVVPSVIIGSIGLFYIVLFAAGGSVASAEAGGWLLGPFPEGARWRFLTGELVTGADWGVVASQLPRVATLIPIALVAMLLNVGGIEIAHRREVDLNRELRALGTANVASAAIAGTGGYHALSLTVLGKRLGGDSRIVPVGVAVVCAIALIAGPAALNLFPTVVVGGLLAFLGLAFLVEWVYESWSRLPRAEYLLVLLILAVVALVGFFEGVAVGIVAALILFAVNYSKTQPIKHFLTGDTFRSNVERPESQRRILQYEGGRIWVLELHGFLFFGTATALLDGIKGRLGRERAPCAVILDMRRVTGMDSSAVIALEKIRQLVGGDGADLLLTSTAEPLRLRLQASGFAHDPDAGVLFLPDLDHGLERCEDRLIAMIGARASHPDGDGAGSLDLARFRRSMERLEVAAGETLIRQGDAADAMFWIESGRMTVWLELPEQRLRLRRLLPGTVVGEIGLYLGGTRSSSVVADEACVVYRIDRARLDRLAKRAPERAAALHEAIATLTAQRLAEANTTIETLLR